jgi:hypothetical protein
MLSLIGSRLICGYASGLWIPALNRHKKVGQAV